MDDPDRTALGPDQRAWLWQELEGSTARWRLLANPSVMGQTWNPDLPADIRPALKKVKLIADDEQGPDWDQWDGYPVERDALLAHIDEHDMENVVVLSGRCARLARRPSCTKTRSTSDSKPIAVEIVTPIADVAEPRRQDGLAATRRGVARGSSGERSSSSRTGSGSTSTATGTSSST